MSTTPLGIDVPGITTPSSPYPSAIRSGDLLFVSGQVAFTDGGEVDGDDVTTQTANTLARLERVLIAEGLGLGDVVSTTVFLTHASDAAAFNAAWGHAFGTHRPARATVVVDLLDPALLVEVQAVASFPRTTNEGSRA